MIERLAPSVTFFRDSAAGTKTERAMPLAALAALIRDTSAPAKGALPWLKLARYGNYRTDKGSLRHDRNVIVITGVEADYDAEQIGFDESVEIAEKAGLLAILYTSPSHTTKRSRWRILAPTSREFPPEERRRLLGRLNGLYRGVFAHESWTLSQSYYFGRVAGNRDHQVEIVEGQPIDHLDELDAIWRGPATGEARKAVAALGEGGDVRDDAELVRRIVTGDGYHVELTALAARYIGRGVDVRAVAQILKGFMLARPADARDGRWHDRYRSIGGILSSAAQKFGTEAERRRAIARLTHTLLRQRRSGAEIKTAILAEAEHLDLASPTALAITGGILNGQRNAR